MNLCNRITISATVLVLSVCVSAQDLRKRAEENPLSTVFYLLSTTEKDEKVEQKACLAKSLAKAERFTEIEDAARMAPDGSYDDKNLSP